MNTHELANRLLKLPNLPVATRASGNIYESGTAKDFGRLQIGLMKHYTGEHIIIGNGVSKEALDRLSKATSGE